MLLLLLGSAARAHEGPPYAVLVDRPVAGYLVSVWADPDVGTGTVYVMTDPVPGSAAPAAPTVEVRVQPVTRRLAVAGHAAVRQAMRRVQFVATPTFDREERWTLTAVVTPPGGRPHELAAEVDVTPPGLGRWDLVVNMIPFVLFGGVWGLALRRRWGPARQA